MATITIETQQSARASRLHQITDPVSRMKTASKLLNKACYQLLLLDEKKKQMEHRYTRAVDAGRHSFCYTLRLQLSAIHGVKSMIHHFATHLADVIDELTVQYL